jgi:predicted transcriptional regulator
MGGCYVIADSDSNIAWHRVQLKKNRDAVKALETARFTVGEIAGSTGQTKQTIAKLKRKIAESELCIAAHEKRTKRPLATDLQSLASMSWSSWNNRGVGRR